MIQITPKIFYKSGSICFSIVAIGGLINYINYWSLNNIISRITGLASVAFNFILAGFFIYLLKSLDNTNLPSENLDDLDEAIKEFKKNGS